MDSNINGPLYGMSRAILEANIGKAHRALFQCAQQADALDFYGLAEDCRMLLIELERVQTSLLKRTIAPRIRLGTAWPQASIFEDRK